MGRRVSLSSVLGLAARERMARPGRTRVPEPMVMDDPAGARAFHDAASRVQLPVYELNASMMSRLLPAGGSVLDLGSGSGQLAAHLASGRPDVSVTCVDLSDEMLGLGRAMAAERGLDQLHFVSADITDLPDELAVSPDLVCCSWTLHQLPDRDSAVAALRRIATVRAEHGSAVWIFDFARLRSSATMPTFYDLFSPSGHERLRTDALASEAAAWTVDEMGSMLDDAGLTGLERSRAQLLGVYQAWWATGGTTSEAPAWQRPPMSDDAAYWADRTIASMGNLPPA